MFKWCRITLLLLIFGVVVTGVYLNKAGLPGWAKDLVIDHLKAEGWQVDFSRVRLRWYRGILAEDLQIRKLGETDSGPSFFIEEAQCRLHHAALRNFDLQVDSLMMRDGRLLWPMAEANMPRQALQLENLNGELIFLPGKRWRLSALEAMCMGTRFRFDGILTNGPALLDVKWPRTAPRSTPGPPGSSQVAKSKSTSAARMLQQAMQWIRQLHFEGVPKVDCQFQGDAANLDSLDIMLTVTAPGLESPWGSGTNITINARCFPERTDKPLQVELTVGGEQVRSTWGQADNCRLYLHGLPAFTNLVTTNLNFAVEVQNASTRWGQAGFAMVTVQSALHPTNSWQRQSTVELAAEMVDTVWFQAGRARLDLTLSHGLTNVWPVAWEGSARAERASTRWGEADAVEVGGHGNLPGLEALTQTNAAWPERLSHVHFDITGSLTNLNSPRLSFGGSVFAARWEDARLHASIEGALGEGQFYIQTAVDTPSRLVVFNASSSIDPTGIAGLMTPEGRRWLDRYSWTDPPRAEVRGTLVLPGWSHRQPDWKGEVRPTLTLAGRFDVGRAGYRGIHFTSAASPFTLTNLSWQLTDLKVTRPEGDLTGTYGSHMETRDFHWTFHSRFLPTVIQPLFEAEQQQRVFNFFHFKEPPDIRGELSGNWGHLEDLTFQARVEATNMVFRGEPILSLSSDVALSNKWISLYQPRARRTADESGAASGVGIDLKAQKLYITNAFGRVNPAPITRMIGHQAEKAMKPYIFDQPPTAHVEGIVDIKRKSREYDLRFDVSGGPFHWQSFHLDEVRGNLHWLGDTLTMTNLEGVIRGGQVRGHAWFDFTPGQGTQFRFQSEVTNINFHTFMEDLVSRTNRLEGELSGNLTITDANADDWDSWQGYGAVTLRDGLIWDIPMFGVFSPILNVFIPGIGNIRARDASASFGITNSLIYTSDLEVNATAMRMQFRGRSDFHRRIEGRMEAELLRNMPAVGFILSKVLWPVTKLFEFKLNGTVEDPKTEPVYIIPKIVLLPFSPFKSLKEIFMPQESPPASGTAPAPAPSP